MHAMSICQLNNDKIYHAYTLNICQLNDDKVCNACNKYMSIK